MCKVYAVSRILAVFENSNCTTAERQTSDSARQVLIVGDWSEPDCLEHRSADWHTISAIMGGVHEIY